MPGRQFTSTNYRYGFNNKEKDDEVKGNGNEYDYGMRIYDPRMGKFLSIDPLISKYPCYTPYLYAGNKPIRCIDINGANEFSQSEEWEQSTWIIGMWNQARNGLGNVFAIAYSALVTSNVEGQNIRRNLERQGYQVGTISNADLAKAFQVRFDDGEVTVQQRAGWKENLLDLGISVLDASSVITMGGGKYGAGILCIEVSPAVKQGVADILRIIKVNARKGEILSTWLDSRTKAPLREAEASALALFEEASGSKVRASTFYEAGDAIATSGKYAGKSIEHMGGFKAGFNNMESVLGQIKSHLNKAEVLLLDLRNFSKGEKEVILKNLQQNHSQTQLSKIIKIE